MTAISVRHLSKTFGRFQALKGVNLEIRQGEMVALIGASGSGKSTLIRHLAGLERADSGQSVVEIFGERMQASGRLAPGARRMRREIGVVFQQFNLVSRLPVLTNVLLGVLGRIPSWRGTLGLFNPEEKALARSALARVGIPNVVWQRASTLSGGQQQRAAIARTLVQQARILLADEPIASLDPASARRVMDVLSDINAKEGITAVVSLHQVEYARAYCPRTIAMRAGQVVYDGPSTALTDDFLKDLYGLEAEDLTLPGGDEAAEVAIARPIPSSKPQAGLTPVAAV
ncbi:Phosphate-import ATP-binding protein PhnC [Hartmannibacter diazotrophicus]|uniref:Phosphate-import ATP-binding protein PhnC n=1 Tax=Hartmannibacter diazotrophicus TaxID=1482074 RepID=A0A2C9D6E1_9HYPH|nr:phosphonate ABC transporter ATP-binding protein [Hartmannibacter diazotrophicus]SON55311.1 Phosphate-import ATP-binding protein PhnC [Hartmannibacter diazotrophicus]